LLVESGERFVRRFSSILSAELKTSSLAADDSIRQATE